MRRKEVSWKEDSYLESGICFTLGFTFLYIGRDIFHDLFETHIMSGHVFWHFVSFPSRCTLLVSYSLSSEYLIPRPVKQPLPSSSKNTEDSSRSTRSSKDFEKGSGMNPMMSCGIFHRKPLLESLWINPVQEPFKTDDHTIWHLLPIFLLIAVLHDSKRHRYRQLGKR